MEFKLAPFFRSSNLGCRAPLAFFVLQYCTISSLSDMYVLCLYYDMLCYTTCLRASDEVPTSAVDFQVKILLYYIPLQYVLIIC